MMRWSVNNLRVREDGKRLGRDLELKRSRTVARFTCGRERRARVGLTQCSVDQGLWTLICRLAGFLAAKGWDYARGDDNGNHRLKINKLARYLIN